MRIFRRTSPPVEAISSAVVLEDGMLSAPDARARLRRIVAEAVVLQDEAEAVLADIRAREPLDRVARRGGPLARRFFALRAELPVAADAALARQCETASVLLDYMGTLLVSALKLLAADLGSPAIGEQLERLDGLGAPAERLDALYRELSGSASSSMARS